MPALRDDISVEQLTRYLRRTGERGAAAMSALQKNRDYVNALHTDAGKAVILDEFNTWFALLEKIIDGTADDEERVTCKVLRKLMDRHVAIINRVAEGESRLQDELNK